ncbi:hypothetical protein M2422_001699 [Enterobacter sp. SLBN-59]|nr:hypothetical protein [Enterobacter sp. SLBN-59]
MVCGRQLPGKRSTEACINMTFTVLRTDRGWHCRVATEPYPAYKKPNPLYCRHPSLIIIKNRFTVRERSKRRQQSAISV